LYYKQECEVLFRSVQKADSVLQKHGFTDFHQTLRDVAKLLWTWILTNKQCSLNTDVFHVQASSFHEMNRSINSRSGSFQKTEYSNYTHPLPPSHPFIKLQVHIFLLLRLSLLSYSYEKQLVFTKHLLCLFGFFHRCSASYYWLLENSLGKNVYCI